MFLKKFLNGYQPLRNKYTYARIHDISEKRIGESLTVKGWIKANRVMKKAIFIDINDGSSNRNLQVYMNKEMKLKEPNMAYGASVMISGTLSQTPKGQLEIQAEDVKVIGSCPSAHEGYPFVSNQTHAPEYIREYPHLRTHVGSVCSLLRVRHHAKKAFNKYLDDNGYIECQAPVLSSNDCEGAGEIFIAKPESDLLLRTMKKDEVPLEQAYFDKKVFLTVSGQLHLEAMASHLGSVYSFNQVFRSENNTSLHHLAEFTMLEVEKAFVDSIEETTTTIEDMIKTVTTTLLNTVNADMQNASQKKGSSDSNCSWVDKKFPRITYTEAGEILQKNSQKLKNPFIPLKDFNREQELFLVDHLQSPVFVIDWPKELKPFYVRGKKDNPEVVGAVDLLMPVVGELVGGSLREDNYGRLESKLPTDNLQWYLDLRKFGGSQTAGFGIGFDRYLQLITGVVNIRDVVPFPRWAHNCAL